MPLLTFPQPASIEYDICLEYRNGIPDEIMDAISAGGIVQSPVRDDTTLWRFTGSAVVVYREEGFRGARVYLKQYPPVY